MDILLACRACNCFKKQNSWTINPRNIALNDNMINKSIVYLSLKFFKNNYENLPDKLLYFNDKLEEDIVHKDHSNYPFYLMYIVTFTRIPSNKYIIFIFAGIMEKFKLPTYLKYLSHSYIFTEQFIYNNELLYLISSVPLTNLYPQYLLSISIEYVNWNLTRIDNPYMRYLCHVSAFDKNRHLNRII
jgi:hypothetical protein